MFASKTLQDDDVLEALRHSILANADTSDTVSR
jgi:hypothetical protein